MNKSIIESLSWNTIAAIILSVISFLYSIITARLIGPELIGKIIVYISIIELLSTISNFSFGNTIIQENNIPTEKLMGTGLWLSIITAAIFISIGGIYSHLFIENSFKIYFIFLLIFKSFAIIGSVFDAGIKKEFYFKRESQVRICVNVLSLIISIILIVNGLPVEAIIINYGLKEMTVILLYFFLPSQCKKFSFDKSIIRIFLKNGKFLFVSSTIVRLRDYIDKYIINFFVQPAQIAVYSKGQGLSRIIPNTMLTIVRSIFLSTFSKFQSNSEKTRKIIKNSSVILFRVIIVVCISLAICSNEVVYFLLGSEWLGSVKIIKYGVISAIVYPIITFERMILLGNGEYATTTKVAAIDFVIYLLFILLGSKYLGIIGVILGINISAVIILMIISIKVYNKFAISVFEGSRLFIIINSIFYFIMIKFDLFNQYNMFVSIIIKLAIYALLLGCYILIFDREKLQFLLEYKRSN